MGEEELLNQAEQAAARLRMESLAREGRHPWLEETLTVCGVATAVVVIVVFSVLK